MTEIAKTAPDTRRKHANVNAGRAGDADTTDGPNGTPDAATATKARETAGTTAEPGASARARARPSGRATASSPKKKIGTTTGGERPRTKAAVVLKMLHSAKGASMAEMTKATGWQAHSVRGFLSGTVKKKHGLPVIGVTGKNGVRRYRIAEGTDA